MSFLIKPIAAGREPAFQNIAPDVFDEPVDPLRLADYLVSPGHLMVRAFAGDLVVG